jgi:hypothetical protein
MDKKLQGVVWPTRTKAASATNAVKRVTWAKIVQMVAFLNQIWSIMISVSSGTIWMELVLWGRLVHLNLAWETFGFLSTLWLIP